jgi:hypothetical protein
VVLVDPGIDGSELNQLADDLDRLGDHPERVILFRTDVRNIGGSYDPCYVDHLNYGGSKDAYLGSQDNGGNPTKKELDEIVAILASATRVH